jgi:hypothetical protein
VSWGKISAGAESVKVSCSRSTPFDLPIRILKACDFEFGLIGVRGRNISIPIGCRCNLWKSSLGEAGVRA